MYLQGGSKLSGPPIYSAQSNANSSSTLVDPAGETVGTSPLNISKAPSDDSHGSSKQTVAVSAGRDTDFNKVAQESEEVPIVQALPPSVDQRLSTQSLYRKGTTSNLNYTPRLSNHRHNSSDFSITNLQNTSQQTLVPVPPLSRPSSHITHLDLEKPPRDLLGGQSGRRLPITFPITPTTPRRRVLIRRAGRWIGLCGFAILVIAVGAGVHIMMLAVNLNLDTWGQGRGKVKIIDPPAGNDYRIPVGGAGPAVKPSGLVL